MSPPLDSTPLAWAQGPEIELPFLPGSDIWPVVASTPPEFHHFNHSDEVGGLYGVPSSHHFVLSRFPWLLEARAWSVAESGEAPVPSPDPDARFKGVSLPASPPTIENSGVLASQQQSSSFS